ncbi:MAG: CHASE2 domain-containing protein [Alphaproteobacteria bacterium]|nr:CHASE2 domain-containing protein [Alphaproteobacteria bacterium]
MKQFLLNKWVHLGLLFLFLLVATSYSYSNTGGRQQLQNIVFDQYNKIQPREKTDKIIIVDLDEESLEALGQWPWPRTVVAKLVQNLTDLGAKVIAFDMVFAEQDRTSPRHIAQNLPDMDDTQVIKSALKNLPDNDYIFSQTIKSSGNVVTGFSRAKEDETRRNPHLVSAPTVLVPNQSVFKKSISAPEGVATNLPIFSKLAAGNGHFMATPEGDGIIRRVQSFYRFPKEPQGKELSKLYPSLALEALRVYVDPKAKYILQTNKTAQLFDSKYIIRLDQYRIPMNERLKMWVYYRDIGDSDYVSAHKIINNETKESLRSSIEDKIVFIGTSAEGLRDIRSTPLGLFEPGVEVHANVLEQILQGSYLTRPDKIVDKEAVVILAAGLSILLLAAFIHLFWVGLVTFSLIGAMFGGSWYAFSEMGLLLDPVYPSAVLFVLFIFTALLAYVRSESEKSHIRGAFGYYISPDYMEELTKNPDSLKLGGETKELSIMFTDIRSFTKISESLEPEELTQLMNDFLTPMSDLVMDNKGTIDKYMGDAMMAFWNAPLDDTDHARNACLTALKMNEALVPVNDAITEKAKEKGEEPKLLSAGIGINTGSCSVGNMGSQQRFAYSALGDSVNLASRLEGQTKTYGVDVLVGEETRNQVRDLAFIELDLIQVIGKEQPVRVFTLIGDVEIANNKAFKKWQAAHNGMMAAYRAGDFDCAIQDLKEAREAADAFEENMLAYYYDIYKKRIMALIKKPPQGDWDGVFVATSK